MIKGLAITPPVIGRISIGRLVEKNGKLVPEKDDAFTITTLVQKKDGWLVHPLQQKLNQGREGEKLRSIPVRVLFNNPDLNFRAEYSLFDRATARPVCVGNGETARRATGDGIAEVPCPSPDLCELGQEKGCKPYGRLNVQIEGQEDDLGSFVFRTTGFNSIRTLAARLTYFQAVSGGLLSCLPLGLKLKAKSTTQSYRTPVYYVDLVVREGMNLEAAIAEAKKVNEERTQAGFDVAALEKAAEAGFANGSFEDTSEEVPQVLEEFFEEDGGTGTQQQPERQQAEEKQPAGLKAKLATAGKPRRSGDNSRAV